MLLRDLTRSFLSNLSSKDPMVARCCTFLSSPGLCRVAVSHSGRPNSSCAFCMNVLWRLTVRVCTSAQECASSVALPALGQGTRTGPTNPHLLDSGAKLQIRVCLLFLCPFLKSETMALVVGAYPRAKLAYDHRCRLQEGQKEVIYKPGATLWYVVHYPCPEVE